jgi:hypothetical protein
MSEPNKPAKLPEKYRKPPPQPPPRTVADMRIGDSYAFPMSAVCIDDEWGVWIAPDARVLDKGGFDPSKRPIVISRTQQGYVVAFGQTNNLEGKLERATTLIPTPDFIPAYKVI